jgi:two-component system cell cycle sensor histidine kinase/response regulator CckA
MTMQDTTADIPLRILCLEGDAPDAELVATTLREAHMLHTLDRVATREALTEALAQAGCDLILADSNLLTLDGLTALREDRTTPSDLPIILLADDSDEQTALEALHRGATDYVLRQRLTCLPLVVTRAVREAENRQQRQQTEHALRAQEERDRRMEVMATVVGGIAHEFSDILNNVLGFTSLVKKYSHDHGKVLKYSQAIEQSVQRGDEVAQRLRAFARLDKRAPEPVKVSALMDEVAGAARSECPERVSVMRKCDADLPEILAVRKELVQALMNLCRNARDAILQNAPAGGRGTITIGADRSRVTDDIAPALMLPVGEECVALRVSDDGVGIRQEIAGRIFDPFFTTKESVRGAGLGLSIVYTVVRGHHGTILVESSPGNGSTFRILLPAYSNLRAAQGCNAEPRARKTELILLVDDERPMLDFGRDILADHGYRVLTASDGAEALEIYRLQSGEIALVVLDLIMPRVDGGQAYVAMKQINPSVRAMFCSGSTSDDVISSLLNEEHLRAIRKPFKIEEFLAAVRETLDAPPV